ncbi:hypothetical protein Tco_0228794 [Tanacetum coccineum]
MGPEVIRRTPGFELKLYADADYSRNSHDTRRSTILFAQFLDNMALYSMVIPKSRKMLCSNAVNMFNTRRSKHIETVTTSSKSRSNGHTVADSIGERSKRPTTYKFKTDCSIIPVWLSYGMLRKGGDVVPPGYSYECSWPGLSDCAQLMKSRAEEPVKKGSLMNLSDHRCSSTTVIMIPQGIIVNVTDQIEYRPYTRASLQI